MDSELAAYEPWPNADDPCGSATGPEAWGNWEHVACRDEAKPGQFELNSLENQKSNNREAEIAPNGTRALSTT